MSRWLWLGMLCWLASYCPLDGAETYTLHRFDRQQLTDVYYSEGANVGDLNRDGKIDIVHGPYWFAGPDYQAKREIYPAKAQPRERYADNFFSWVYDFTGDGWNDVFVVGFPGTPAYVYENPTDRGFDQAWPKHQVFDQVSNESPHFVNLVGDERPELVCTHNGYWGYATIDWQRPLAPWTFHNVSRPTAPKPFGHGLGVGDIDGDQRMDILMKDGWYQQPASLEGDPEWRFFPAPFARAGGAEMYAYDVDGDGDNDVITSLQAHEFGLAWYEQLQDGEQRVFRPHVIMGSKVDENRYGVLFSELHSVNMADIDGDGLKDIVTGKTYWSHHTQSPMWDAGAVVYWFRLVRGPEGVDWVPYEADSEAGIGRQLIVADVNGDKLPDLVAGGMKGCHVLRHRQETVDRDTWLDSQPKPRVAMADGLRPEEAARRMTVPAGFRVDLAAGEPQVHQPVAFALDERGRVWVAEAYTYPTRAPEGEGRDKIVILEDTDRDGSLDKRTVFAEGLNLVSGLEVGFGGVWVGAAPYLLFVPDANQDDVPDGPPQVLLDGFGFHDTHETLNGFIWGPDGWLYGCHGVFTHSRVGAPGTPDDQRVPLNAGIWRFHPQRRQFEVFAWGTSNPWGVDFNDHGQAFCTACVIPHLYHVIQGARYQRQAGQHFDPYVFDDIKTIADHVHYAGNIRDHAWWGQEPADIPADTSAAGGGHAHCGAMIYLGDNWPAKYRNRLFFNNIHGNRVNCDELEREGSGYVGHHGKDLLLANDHWFRGINLKSGIDGSVYLIDWYDKNACHRVNPLIWDRTNGRIYRVSYAPADGDREQRGTAFGRVAGQGLVQATEDQLIDCQRDDNEWHVRTARRMLQHRGISPGGQQRLADLVRGEQADRVRLRALWTLHAAGAWQDQQLQSLLADRSEYVRAWTIQLLAEDRQVSPETLVELTRMASQDESALVRLYLASAVQRLSLEQRWSLVAALCQHAEDAQDHNLPLMVWYGLEPLVTQDAARALQLASRAQIPQVARFILRRAAADNRTLNDVVLELAAAETPEGQRAIMHEILLAFEGRLNIPMPPAWEKAYRRVADSTDREVRAQATQIAVALGDQRVFPALRAELTDPSGSLEDRQRALDILVRGRDPQAAVSFRQVLSDTRLRGAAIRALAGYEDRETAPAILAIYPSLADSERRDAIGTLVSRPSFAVALLDALKEGKIPRTDLHAYHIRQLVSLGNAGITQRIQEEWGGVRETSQDKQTQIARLRRQLTRAQLAKADTGNGRQLFAKNCATCHVLFGEGTKVGPDITGSNRANLDYVLENVVDPSAVLGKDYRMSVLVCSDGRVISGLVQKETDTAVTVRTINDTIVVAKADIEEQQLSDLSLMPERLLDNLRPDEIRDLVAYLASPTQVPFSKRGVPVDPKTGRVLHALEGESLRVLTRSAGRTGAQDMGRFSKDSWSGAEQLWWTGARPGARLELAIPVPKAGKFVPELVLTKARDYGVVQLYLDDEKLGGPIDLYNTPDVTTTGLLEFEGVDLAAGEHKLAIEIVGANPGAIKSYMFGLDYVRLRAP
ncbi:MAG: PVC-type heme-binding CxxCH protein [Pirellulaceae bacterium]